MIRSADGRVSVAASSGTLSSAVEVTIQAIAAPPAGAVGPAYQIGPSGIALTGAVTITFSYASLELGGATPEQLRVATYDGVAWSAVPSRLDDAAKTVSAETTHFSPWALTFATNQDGGASDGGGDADAARDAADAGGDAADAGGDAADAGGGTPDGGAAFFLASRYMHNARWVGDFDGDGKVDMAELYSDAASGRLLQMYKGRGDGSALATPVSTTVTLPGNAISAPFDHPATTGDFDGDGRADIAILFANSSFSPTAWGLIIARGQQDGTFNAMNIQLPYTSNDQRIVITREFLADFTGDGKTDVFLASITGAVSDPANTQYYRGHVGWTVATYAAATGWTFRETSGGFDITWKLADRLVPAAGDFDGDGRLDAIVPLEGNLHLVPGNGDGTFKPTGQPDANADGGPDAGTSGHPTTIVATFAAAFDLASGDLDADGKVDVAVSSAGLGVQLLWGAGDGSFPEKSWLPTAKGSAPFIADFDGDGRRDILSNVSQLAYGTGGRAFGRTRAIPVYVSAVLDVNGDGAPDLVSQNQVYVGRTRPPGPPDNMCTATLPSLDLCLDPESF